ncbi:Ig-like domain-containing protein [Pantoea sp. SS70]|uniref:Ig-like domain-containing protein n=1 Tax=Pantoea sp. SS70 TaxID=3024247 RepID=UPI0024531B1E|nr:Ig-like domain-containing protein [Pantoea sp. SS70]WGK55889.1 Ig-like domain-containing protein [Pantoea sp. SS70]
MNDLLARSPVFYRESADGRLVFGNKTALEPGGFIELVIGTDTFRVPVDDKGFYRWEAPTPYADGEYSFSIRHFDAAGNRSTPTLGTVIVDTTAPAAPKLINLYDDQGAVTGSFDAGKATDDKRPTLTGIAQKGSTVYLLNDKNEKIGSAVADKVTGQWVIEPSQDLNDGVNSLRLMAEETFGGKLRAGAPSPAFDIVIAGDDVRVTITDALDDAGSFTGSLGHGALTDDATPTLRGEVSAGSTVIVYYRLAGSPTWAGSATATVSGDSWSWTPGSNLPDGRYEFQASTGEVASVLFELEIAGTSGIAQRTRIESVTDDFGPVTGPLANGAMTDDATPTFQGRAEANSQVVIRYTLAGGAAASVTVNADSTGHWRWTPGVNLATGQWTFDVKSQGQSGWNDSFTLTINPDADRNATIDSALDDFGPVTGSLSSGSSTDDTTPTLRGSGPANSTITLRYKLGSGEYASTTVNVDSSGHWTWTPSALAKGSWTFEVQKAGQSGWSSFTLTIDPDLDRNATIDSAWDDFSVVTGSLASGGSTDDTTPTLRGSGPANSTITLRYKMGSGEYASTTLNVDSSGHWTWTPSALAKGSWTFEVQRAGQSGWSSFTLTVDPALDLKPSIDSAWDDFGAVTGSLKSGDITDDSTPTLRGRGVAGSVIYFQSGTWDGSWYDVGSTVVKADGSWEWASPALSHSTTWEFRAMARLGGADSEWSGKFVLEYNNPAPTITDAFDDFGAETGSLASGDTTDDQTPTLRGTAPADSVVMIRAQHASGETTYSVQADADGKWSWTPDKALPKGDWDFQVKQSGAENWGESFELNIIKEYSGKWGELDFENVSKRTFVTGSALTFNDNSEVWIGGHSNNVTIAHLVKTPKDAPDSWGEQCLYFSQIGGMFLWNNKNITKKDCKFSELGCDIWNNSGLDTTFRLYYTDRPNNTKILRFTVKAGEIFSFNSADYIGNDIHWFDLGLLIDNNDYYGGIYFDNVYSVEEYTVSSMDYDGPENIIHFLDAVDEFTDHPITGSETQVDTLQLTGKDQLLDLSQHKAEIQSVEIFDIRGSGDNTLKIDLDALLHYGEKDLFIEDGKTQLMVNGDAGDVVQLKDILPEGSDISEWQHQQGTVTVAGVEYEVYSHGDDAELLVQQGVKTELI